MMKCILAFALMAVAAHAYCPNQCSGHGACQGQGYKKAKDSCECYKQKDGVSAAWTGADCSERTCPYDVAWAATPKANNDHTQLLECSGKGLCDRKTGECACFEGFDGEGCRRSTCPDNCNDHGTCLPLKQHADNYSHDAEGDVAKQFGVPSGHPTTTPMTGARYDRAWDAEKSFGCLCDSGYRGPACTLRECPSATDPLGGNDNRQGRECSGRGTCDYTSGVCGCYAGFFGDKCQTQTILG